MSESTSSKTIILTRLSDLPTAHYHYYEREKPKQVGGTVYEWKKPHTGKIVWFVAKERAG